MPNNRTERDEARDYWAGRQAETFYQGDQHWRAYIADAVAQHQPRRVFELGCNVGKNLLEIRKRLPAIELFGLDVNEKAILVGRERYGLDIQVGSDADLGQLPDNYFDVCFTVSVLDHLPAVEEALAELLRIAAQAVYFLEPYSGSEVRADVSDEIGNTASSIPFTYAWDYAKVLAEHGAQWRWRWSPYPLGTDNMAPQYWLIEGSSMAQ